MYKKSNLKVFFNGSFSIMANFRLTKKSGSLVLNAFDIITIASSENG